MVVNAHYKNKFGNCKQNVGTEVGKLDACGVKSREDTQRCDTPEKA